MPRNSAEADEEFEGNLTTSEINPQEHSERPRRGRSAAPSRRKNDHNQGGGGGGLERVTVNLIPRASRALEKASQLTGDSKTDAINRALQVYAYLEEVWSKGGSIEVEVDGKRTELKFF
jgi:hypothetical protein